MLTCFINTRVVIQKVGFPEASAWVQDGPQLNKTTCWEQQLYTHLSSQQAACMEMQRKLEHLFIPECDYHNQAAVWCRENIGIRCELFKFSDIILSYFYEIQSTCE